LSEATIRHYAELRAKELELQERQRQIDLMNQERQQRFGGAWWVLVVTSCLIRQDGMSVGYFCTVVGLARSSMSRVPPPDCPLRCSFGRLAAHFFLVLYA
jgi:hypothetical protein